MTCVAFSIKFTKTNQKFAENSEFCEKNSLFLVNYSLLSLEGPAVQLVAAEREATPDSVVTRHHLGGRVARGGRPAARAGDAALLS